MGAFSSNRQQLLCMHWKCYGQTAELVIREIHVDVSVCFTDDVSGSVYLTDDEDGFHFHLIDGVDGSVYVSDDVVD